ncbi:Filaggrin-2 [Camelus dromedarius]|uniref:Filaggrin-2 n=1 Tax=Camelus dromedarius TaxID=9838 RepID=A0A5N4CQS4_CAMDR|nr:Filaggrin-2 [Camelus dromedarius]
MSSLLENITAIIDLFHQYSKTDKETETLSKKELKELLEVEFRPILKNPDDPDTADVFMHILDIDHDKKIDFTEFFLMKKRIKKKKRESPLIQQAVMERRKIDQRAQEEEEETDTGPILEAEEEEE